DRRPRARDRARAERIGDEGADHPSVVREVGPEDREGILLSRRGDRVDVFLFRPPVLEHVAPPPSGTAPKRSVPDPLHVFTLTRRNNLPILFRRPLHRPASTNRARRRAPS